MYPSVHNHRRRPPTNVRGQRNVPLGSDIHDQDNLAFQLVEIVRRAIGKGSLEAIEARVGRGRHDDRRSGKSTSPESQWSADYIPQHYITTLLENAFQMLVQKERKPKFAGITWRVTSAHLVINQHFSP